MRTVFLSLCTWNHVVIGSQYLFLFCSRGVKALKPLKLNYHGFYPPPTQRFWLTVSMGKNFLTSLVGKILNPLLVMTHESILDENFFLEMIELGSLGCRAKYLGLWMLGLLKGNQISWSHEWNKCIIIWFYWAFRGNMAKRVINLLYKILSGMWKRKTQVIVREGFYDFGVENILTWV